MIQTNVQRGDIFYADLFPVVGSEQGGIRPVLILQNDIGNQFSPTTIIAPLTSQYKHGLPTHISISGFGLTKESTAELEQVRTIDKGRLKEYVGHLSEEKIQEVESALKISLGLKEETKTENNLITVSGVTGYIDENGTAWLNTENVARGLGFTQTKNGIEYVRWETVNGYISDLGFSQLVGKEFIPENLFYRLGFKAGNKTAEIFQAKVADEILPAIRKTGSYSVKAMTPIQMLAAQAQAMAELEKKTNVAIESANNAQKQISGAVEALAAPTPVNWQTVTGEKIRRICRANGLSYLQEYDALYRELERNAHVDLQSRVNRLKGRMKKAGYTCKECAKVTQLHVISRDPILKMAFDGIVRRFAAKYVNK